MSHAPSISCFDFDASQLKWLSLATGQVHALACCMHAPPIEDLMGPTHSSQALCFDCHIYLHGLCESLKQQGLLNPSDVDQRCRAVRGGQQRGSAAALLLPREKLLP